MVRNCIKSSALAIALLALLVMVWAVTHATARYVWRLSIWRPDADQRYRADLEKGLLRGLEFLVPAHLLRTVALEKATFEEMGTLMLLVLARAFLSWSVVVDGEGCVPGPTCRRIHGVDV